jgi:hypothetical protein
MTIAVLRRLDSSLKPRNSFLDVVPCLATHSGIILAQCWTEPVHTECVDQLLRVTIVKNELLALTLAYTCCIICLETDHVVIAVCYVTVKPDVV